jgi:phosphate starvation-inducible PhoH-like protein
VEVLIEVRSPEEVLELFGRRDQHLRLYRERFPGVSLVARNGVIKLTGPADGEVEEADRLIRSLLRRVRRRETLTQDEVEEALRGVLRDRDIPRPPPPPRPGAGVGLGGAFGPGAFGPGGAGAGGLGGTRPGELTTAEGVRESKPRTAGQARYLELIDKNEIVFAIGPAGTGKTFLAVAKAVEALKQGAVARIILSRPAVEAGEKLGFLPGDFHAKVNPYLKPLYDSLNDLLDPETVKKLIEREIIEIVPLAYMRGRTLNRAFIILDEAQNTTAAQMKMFLTRMGEGSRIVVTGDETQVDLQAGKLSGLRHVQRILRDIPGIAFQRMTKSDIVRHPLVWKIVQAYERAEAPPPPTHLPGGHLPAGTDGDWAVSVSGASASASGDGLVFDDGPLDPEPDDAATDAPGLTGGG